jgi:hypothetical protein
MLSNKVLAATLIQIMVFCGVTIGGDKAKNDLITISDRVPNMLLSQSNALGVRTKTKDKEKTVYEGELLNAAGQSSKARVTIQTSGMVKLEGFKGSESEISFDGNQSKGIINRMDESIIETFLMDTAESILTTATRTAAVRLLGRNYSLNPRTAANDAGPRYDIYEVSMPIVYKKTVSRRPKQFYFDAKTHLLAKTEYCDRSVTPAVKVETCFSVWGTIDGSAYPAKIDHYENGTLVFSFIATKIEGGGAIDASNFR